MRRCAAMILVAISGSVAFLGCTVPGFIGKPQNPAATQPATVVDPKLAESAYWLAQPATSQLTGRDFTTMWNAAEQVAHDYYFKIDLRDFRGGQLVTEPLIGKQFFELWKKDSATGRDVAESTLDSIRRTVHFQFTQNEGGTYTVTPKVVVEKLSSVEAKYRENFELPPTYWYAVRRDAVLEQKLTEALRKRLEGRS